MSDPRGRPPGRTARLAEAPARQSRPRGVLVVCALVAGTQMTWGLVVPVLPVYADDLGASTAALSLVVAAFGLGRLAINLPAGALAQHLDKRRLLVGAVLAVSLCTFATGLVTTVAQLVGTRVLLGLAGGLAITAGQALLTDTEPDRLARTMGTLQAYQLAGAAAGPILGGLLVGIDARLPFFAGGALLVVLCVVGALARRPDAVDPAAATLDVSNGERPRLLTAGLIGISAVGFTVFLVRFGGQQFLFPVLAYDLAGLSPAELGLAMGVTTVLSLILTRPAAALADRFGRRLMTIVSTGTLTVAVLGFLAADLPVVFLAALALTGVATALTGPPSVAYLAGSVDPRRRGLAVGVYRTCGDVATLIGPIALGALLDAGAGTAAVLVLAAITLLACATFALLSRHRPPASPANPPAGARPADLATTKGPT